MGILAHLDDPPRPRWPGVVVGLVAAAPIAAALVLWIIPSLVGAVLGGARDLDRRLTAEGTYMQGLCSARFDMQRDEALCQCVLATEYPALDCQIPFRRWSLARQAQACSDPATHKQALSFCSCVDAVVERVAATPDPERATAEAAYERCMPLPDAFQLPELTDLVDAP